MSEKISIVTILHGEKDFIPLIKHNYNLLSNPENHKNYLQELELIIIDDGKENLSDYIHINYLKDNTRLYFIYIPLASFIINYTDLPETKVQYLT